MPESYSVTGRTRDGRMLLHSTTEAVAPLASDRLLNEAKIRVEANLAPLAARERTPKWDEIHSGWLQ